MPPPDTTDPPRFEPLTDQRPNDAPWPKLRWPILHGTKLTGDTVQLSAVDPVADAAALFHVLDHDEVWTHVAGRPASPDHFEDVVRAWQTRPDWHTWAVRTAVPVAGLPAGAVVGTTSYLDVAPEDARLEIGATLTTPAVWATTVNPESKLLLLGFAFDDLQAGRVQLKTDIRNRRSQQAIARLGARYEGTLRRHHRRDDGTVRDSVLHSITAEEWPAVRERLTARLRPSGR